MLGEVALADGEDVVTGQKQVQKRFHRRRVEVRKFLGGLDEAVVTGKVFEEQAWHDNGLNGNIRRLTISLLIKSASLHLHQLRYSCRTSEAKQPA